MGSETSPDGEEPTITTTDDSGKDGHIWLDPQNAKAIVATSSQTLEARYPEYAAKFDGKCRWRSMRASMRSLRSFRRS